MAAPALAVLLWRVSGGAAQFPCRIEVLLALPAAWYAGAPLGRRAWADLRARRLTRDVAVLGAMTPALAAAFPALAGVCATHLFLVTPLLLAWHETERALARRLLGDMAGDFRKGEGYYLLWTLAVGAAAASLGWCLLPGLRTALGAGVWADMGLAPDGDSVPGLALCAAMSVWLVASPLAWHAANPITEHMARALARRHGIHVGQKARPGAARRVSVMAFERAGILTEGAPSVTRVIPMPGNTPGDVLGRAAALLSAGEHPLGAAACAATARDALDLPLVDAVLCTPGLGVEAALKWGQPPISESPQPSESPGVRTRAGNLRFMRESGVDIAPLEDTVRRLQTEGHAVVIVAAEARAIGLVAFRDTLKRDSVRAVNALRRLGVRTVLISPEDHDAAWVTVEQAGMDDAVAEVLPHDRGHALRQLLSETIVDVAFVSAGTLPEDTPAPGHMSIVVRPAAAEPVDEHSCTIARPELMPVAWVIQIGWETYYKSIQNHAWSVFYHLVALPAALLGLIHPLAAAALSACAWLVVYINTRRLLRHDPDQAIARLLKRPERPVVFR